MDAERFGWDQDTSIIVEPTTRETAQCMRVVIGGRSFLMHTRSAIDLHHKLGKAISDWIGQAAMDLTNGT